MNEKHNSFSGIMEFAKQKRAAMGASVVLAILSVLAGLVPYYAVSRLLINVMGKGGAGEISFSWAGAAVLGYLLKIILYGKSTLLSHKAAFEILKNIRSAIAVKLSRTSMGYMQSNPSGVFKQMIVDAVDKLEYPLAMPFRNLQAICLGLSLSRYTYLL